MRDEILVGLARISAQVEKLEKLQGLERVRQMTTVSAALRTIRGEIKQGIREAYEGAADIPRRVR